MIKKLKKMIWGADEESNLGTPINKKAEFELQYKNMLIGTLKLADSEWIFEYSPLFERNGLVPIADFPDTSKDYHSADLWPFFAGRLPGLGQPIVREAMTKHQIKDNDVVELLKLFGQKTIMNPYVLVPQTA